MLAVPFRVFGLAARLPCVAARSRPLGIGLSFRVPAPPEPRPYGFRRNHFAVRPLPSAVWFSPARFADHRSAISRSPLVEFSLPPEYASARPSRPAAARQLLSWAFAPYSTYRGRRSTWSRARPPATFRLQGLVTLLTVYSLQSRAGFVSHRQRSWDSPFGALSSREVAQDVSVGRNPPTVSPSVLPIRRSGRGRPSRPRFLGFDPSGNPVAVGALVSAHAAGCSLGFRPLQGRRQKPGPGFRPVSSHALLRPCV
jgi:hypothetical protein